MKHLPPEKWHRAESIFAAALEQPPAERPAAVRAACGDDAELRECVESLLAGHESADGASRATNPTTCLSEPIAEKAGSIIGRYKLLQNIGEGGFGAVFLAEQREPVHRRVALKIIKLGMDTRQVIGRFEAERQALALMDHPCIARVLDAGATEAGRPYFVMEYVKGTPITQYCDENNLSIRERLDLFSHVCLAVQHAHQKGVIHRDIKPGNVLVYTQDGRPHAKVIDFGIAKATDRQLTDKTLFTAHEAFIGTPQYMSPEQAAGSIDIDTRTDVYSLGVLLYELLTGVTPFDAKWLRSRALDEVKRIIREVEPQKPSTRVTAANASGKSGSVGVPPVNARENDTRPTLAAIAQTRQTDAARLPGLLRGDLDWIVMKSLDKDRARRYAAASDLAADLRRHTAGEPVVAAPPSLAYRIKKFVRRNKGPVVASTAIAAALLAGIAGTSAGLWHAKRQERAKDAALVEARDAKTAAETDSYIANLFAAQSAMNAGNWPEARELVQACPKSKRGWEWRFQDLKAKATMVELTGHTDSVGSAAFSPDGTRIVTDSHDATARVWDAATGKSLAKLKGRSLQIPSVAFSPDGTRIVTVSDDDTARVVDAATGNSLAELQGHTKPVLAAAFGPDGTRIVTASSDRTARVWDAATGKRLAELKGHAASVSSAAFSPDGKSVVTASNDITARVWDVATGYTIAELQGHTEFVTAAAFSPDGKRVVTRSYKTVHVWDVATRTCAVLEGHTDYIWGATFSPDGTSVVTASSDNTARVWDVATRTCVVLDGHRDVVFSAAFSPDGKRVVTASYDNTARVWDIATGYTIAELKGHAGSVAAAAFSPDGKRVVTASSDNTARVWDVGTEADLANTAGPELPLGYFDDQFKRRDSGPHLSLCLAVIRGRSGVPMPTALTITTPDGSRRIIGAADGTLRFIDAAADRQVAVFRMPGPVSGLEMTPDGTRLIIALTDGSARVWDIRHGSERIADLQREHAERIPAAAYVDTLWNDTIPAGDGSGTSTPRIATDKLRDTIIADLSLTPLRRLVAAQILDDRLAEADAAAHRAFNAIEKDQTEKSAVQAAALATDLPPRIKEKVIARAEKWEYHAPEPSAEEKLAEETKARRLAEAAFEAQPAFVDPLSDPDPVDRLREAFRTREELLGPLDPLTIQTLFRIGELESQSESSTGIVVLQDAIRRQEAWPMDGQLLSMYGRLALEASLIGEVELVIEMLDKIELHLPHVCDAEVYIYRAIERSERSWRQTALDHAGALEPAIDLLVLDRYRIGDFSGAVRAARLEWLPVQGAVAEPNPTCLAVAAMSHFQLRQVDRAKELLSELRREMANPHRPEDGTCDAEANRLLSEAEALIEGPAATQPGAAGLRAQPARPPASRNVPAGRPASFP
jgi:WD40 repeat protein/serine/threonine protein kinase